MRHRYKRASERKRKPKSLKTEIHKNVILYNVFVRRDAFALEKSFKLYSVLDNRIFVDAILWIAGNAAKWRDFPEDFGKWTGFHACFHRWSHAGVSERLLHAVAGTPDFEYVMIDSTISKVHADATGAKGRLKLPPSVVHVVD